MVHDPAACKAVNSLDHAASVAGAAVLHPLFRVNLNNQKNPASSISFLMRAMT
jgi:hypothetical protein